MDAPRFFLPKSSIDTKAGVVEISKPDLINQMRRVLRLKTSEPLVILDGEGAVYQCNLTQLNSRLGLAKIVGSERHDPLIHPQITVCQALIRGGRFEWVIQKLTELGVSRIVPLICSRSVSKYSGSKLEHWRSIAREAAEQCERISIPPVVEPVEAEKIKTSFLTTGNFASAMKLICLERCADTVCTLAEILDATKMPPDQIVFMIGPEGGFTEAEAACAVATGFIPVSLGPRILRSETAAIAAMAVLISLTEVKTRPRNRV